MIPFQCSGLSQLIFNACELRLDARKLTGLLGTTQKKKQTDLNRLGKHISSFQNFRMLKLAIKLRSVKDKKYNPFHWNILYTNLR